MSFVIVKMSYANTMQNCRFLIFQQRKNRQFNFALGKINKVYKDSRCKICNIKLTDGHLCS